MGTEYRYESVSVTSTPYDYFKNKEVISDTHSEWMTQRVILSFDEAADKVLKDFDSVLKRLAE
jgi:hypothetical protein